MRRLLIFCVLGFLLVIVMGPVQLLLSMDLVVFDIPLILVIYLTNSGHDVGQAYSTSSSGLGGRGIDWSGGVAGILLGYVSDILGGGIKGLHSFTLAAIFLMARRAARHVYLTGPLSTLLVTFVASSASSIIGLSIRLYAGVTPSVSCATVLLAQALLSAITALPLIRLFTFIDAKLGRDTAERGLS